MWKIRRSRDRLLFNMRIPIPGKDGLYIETGPRSDVWWHLKAACGRWSVKNDTDLKRQLACRGIFLTVNHFHSINTFPNQSYKSLFEIHCANMSFFHIWILINEENIRLLRSRIKVIVDMMFLEIYHSALMPFSSSTYSYTKTHRNTKNTPRKNVGNHSKTKQNKTINVLYRTHWLYACVTKHAIFNCLDILFHILVCSIVILDYALVVHHVCMCSH